MSTRREIDRRTREAPRSRARVGLLAYRAAAASWNGHRCTDQEVHTWAAGFIQGYLARKQERKGR